MSKILVRLVRRIEARRVTVQRALILTAFALVSVMTTGRLEAATLAQYQLSPGWATFGLALPQGAATGGVKVGTLATQTDVKTTWPDGSIRFAIVTSKIIVAATYNIVPDAPSGGSLAPTWPKAMVNLTIGGVLYMAQLPAFSGADSWLAAGPLVREARVLVTPVVYATGAPHPLLQVIFDVRAYADGASRVDVTVQNVRDVAAGNSVTYDLAVRMDGALRYAGLGVAHAYLTRWRKTFSSATFVESAVTPDFEPFYLANAIPRYLSTVEDTFPPSSSTAFDPLGFGDMTPEMGAPGGRPEIAPYPDWVARYLIHKRPEQRAYMLKSADLSGSWSGHITEADGQTPISLDAYPKYWLDGRAGTRPLGPNAARVVLGGSEQLAGTTQWLENAHLPSLTFVPYLVTGDRYYLDQMKLWANFSMLATWNGDPLHPRGDGQGVLAQNQVRGIGWPLRNLADTAAYLPNTDPMRGYFVSRVQNNLNWLDTYARTDNGGPLEFTFWDKFQQPPDVLVTAWQNSYVGFALDRARQHGFSPTNALRDRIVRFQVRLFNSAPAYPMAYGAPYYPKVGTITYPVPGGPGVVTLFQTMGQVFTATYGVPPLPPQPIIGYYGPEARMMLIIGRDNGVVGAQNGLAYLAAYRDQYGTSVLDDLNHRSGWALADPNP